MILPMEGFWTRALAIVGEIAFPPVCLSCRRRLPSEEERFFWLCAVCHRRIDTYPPEFVCPACRNRLPTGRAVCHPRADFIVLAPLRYDCRMVRDVIHALKYERAKIAARFLANEIADHFSAAARLAPDLFSDLRDWVIVPIPLHPSRERKRGFNQALALATSLTAAGPAFSGVQIVQNALIKKARTPSQTELNGAEERAANVRGSFGLKDARQIAGRNIFLVDDVFTTGATVRAAAEILKDGGAGKIVALAAART